MSGIANKVKDTLQGGNKSTTHTEHTTHTTTNHTTTPRTTDTYGEPAYNTTGTTHTTAPVSDNYTYGTSGPAPNTDGPHKSDMLNKADPRVDADRTANTTATSGAYHTGPTTTHGTTGAPVAGTHQTHGTTGAPLAGTHQTHGTTGAPVAGAYQTHGTTGAPLAGTHQTHGTTGAPLAGTHQTTANTGVREGEFGPHGSRMTNAADPRVDSDLDSRRHDLDSRRNPAGNAVHGTTAPMTEPHRNHGTTTTTSGVREGEFGPHNSRLANAVDPRVDSDLDSRRQAQATHTTATHGTTGAPVPGPHQTHSATGAPVAGAYQTRGTTGAPLAGAHQTHGTTGAPLAGTHQTHGTTGAPLADTHHTTTGTTHTTGAPVVGGTTTGHTTHTTGTTAGHTNKGAPSSVNVTTGPAPNTAGPHKSDMMNKVDPRVDSNLDGSKTVGGNKTFAGANVDTTRPVQ